MIMDKDTRNALLIVGGLGIVMMFLFGKFTKTGQKIVNEISQAGLNLIAGFEGFSATPYNDPPGSDKYSIGYGHQILPGENFSQPITVEQAKQLLAQDTKKAQDAIRAIITRPLTSAQFDSLTSFVYNVGIGAFKNGTIPAKINAGNFADAAATMRRYNKVRNPAGQLVENSVLTDRRNKEAEAFA